MATKQRSIFDPELIVPALKASFVKLNPVHMFKNPVMFVTEVGAAVTTVDFFRTLANHGQWGFVLQITVWLWFTVLFANFAEAMAEGRGKAQAAAFRKSRTKTIGKRLMPDGSVKEQAAESLRKGDVVLVSAGEIIPADGEIFEGAATVNESAITGESAPV